MLLVLLIVPCVTFSQSLTTNLKPELKFDIENGIKIPKFCFNRLQTEHIAIIISSYDIKLKQNQYQDSIIKSQGQIIERQNIMALKTNALLDTCNTQKLEYSNALINEILSGDEKNTKIRNRNYAIAFLSSLIFGYWVFN